MSELTRQLRRFLDEQIAGVLVADTRRD